MRSLHEYWCDSTSGIGPCNCGRMEFAIKPDEIPKSMTTPKVPAPTAGAPTQVAAPRESQLVMALVQNEKKLDALILHLIDALHRVIDKGDGESRQIAEDALKPENFKYEAGGAGSQAPGGRVFRSFEEFAKEYFPKSRLEWRLVDAAEGPAGGAL